jgi:hypothetical protein
MTTATTTMTAGGLLCGTGNPAGIQGTLGVIQGTLVVLQGMLIGPD